MNSLHKALCLSVMALFAAGNTWATTYTYDDNWINWPGYTSNKTTDENGTPQVDQLRVTTSDDGNYLTKVEILLESSTRQDFDSLFINTDYTTASSWESWDYFVHDGGTTNTANVQGTVPGDGLFTVASNYDYTLSPDQNNVRKNNPDGIDNGSLTASTLPFTVAFNDNNTIDNIITYDFGTGLSLNGGFFVAYAPWCANDVIGGGHMAHMPEPATMLLFGTGLIGLAGFSSRRKKN